MSTRLPCQVCGRHLVPLASGLHRDHRPGHSREPYDRCPGGGYRAERWPVGQHLRHYAGDLWLVVQDRGGEYGDYWICCIAGREKGRAMRAHSEYMHRHGWEAA